ncbi:hypothetical protein Sru01_52130 [Sphaerisporangium rufum]|uniref:DUF397 domain-containing protein n=1 Tax=Sphaerisporangium rufum TaxID=1381558 RepID=A0A919V0M0_9ACTN|nr:DUF397 domain-containing protein [Sphaerisporangium rufum]GII80231.1 hypothetical protein Sru01_52130 [Sphaerisporangium rufum]
MTPPIWRKSTYSGQQENCVEVATLPHSERYATRSTLPASNGATTEVDDSYDSWWKSSASGTGENCVEAARVPGGGRAIRDSKDPDGPVLRFGANEWRVFLSGIKDGRLG